MPAERDQPGLVRLPGIEIGGKLLHEGANDSDVDAWAIDLRRGFVRRH